MDVDWLGDADKDTPYIFADIRANNSSHGTFGLVPAACLGNDKTSSGVKTSKEKFTGICGTC